MKDKIRRAVGVHKIKKKSHLFFSVAILTAGFFSISFLLGNYSQMLRTNVSLEQDSGILPENPVVLSFNDPVIRKYYTGRISISPEESVRMAWNQSGTKLSIYPEKMWQIGQTYKLSLPEGRSALFSEIGRQELSFSILGYPDIKQVFPEKDAKDVVVDIEDPLQVEFGRSTLGFDVKFTLDPEKALTYETDKDNKVFKILPQEDIKDGEKYVFRVFVKYNKESADKYNQIYAGGFETIPPPPSAWEKDTTLRLDQARRFTRARITSGKYIDINLTSQILSIFEDGKLLDAYLVSSGKRGMDTPKGEFKIYNKSPRTWSKQYGLYMPFWMAILPSGKVGIHELPEWPGGYKEGANHLGIPVSHGCVRLGVGPAERVYDWADIGTPVVVY